MIIELLLSPIFLLINGLIAFMPAAMALPDWGVASMALISRALFFFPPDVWAIVLANISFWLFVQLSWAIIEWIYKKIPGVD